MIVEEEPLDEMLSDTEGLGLLGWVRFGVLVVWWLLLPCPPWFEEISSELGYFGFFLGIWSRRRSSIIILSGC